MGAAQVWYVGESRKIELRVEQSDGSVVTHANITEFVVYLLVEGQTRLRFSKTDRTSDGYIQLEQEVEEGVYSMNIEASKSIGIGTGNVSLELKVQSVDGDFGEGYKSVTIRNVLRLVTSNIQNE